MKQVLSAFAVGLLFGIGLITSQLVNPAKVLAFLDIFGAWDASLILVMGSGLIVTTIGYRLVFAMPKPVLDSKFFLPTRNDIDYRLITGSILFGVGWGTAGFCPGPAITSIGFGEPKAILFVAAMIVGMWIFNVTEKKNQPDQPSAATI
jgi:uncharacterized membrane protein YedE/YeeE